MSPRPVGFDKSRQASQYNRPEKTQVCRRHVERVVNPLLKSLRGKAALTMYSLPGKEDADPRHQGN
jgi:hypothetical protein